jgi:hypothetical protein
MQDLLLLGLHLRILKIWDLDLLIIKGELLGRKLHLVVQEFMELCPTKSRPNQRLPHGKICSGQMLKPCQMHNKNETIPYKKTRVTHGELRHRNIHQGTRYAQPSNP